LYLTNHTVAWMAHVHIADLRTATPAVPTMIAAAAAFAVAIVCCSRVSFSRRIAAVGVAAIVGAALWISLLPPRPQFHRDVLEITAIDVGQGDALLLVSPQGRTLLIDGGGSQALSQAGFDVGEQVVAPYQWARGITRLDAVALTHAHADHIGGLSPHHPRLPPPPSRSVTQPRL